MKHPCVSEEGRREEEGKEEGGGRRGRKGRGGRKVRERGTSILIVQHYIVDPAYS